MKKIRHYLALLPALIGLAVLTTACGDDDTPETPILRPLEQHLQGIWMEWKSYKVENGEYIETPNPEDFLAEWDLRSGGEVITNYSYSYSTIWSSTWSVNEEENLLTIEGTEFHIYRLSADEMEIGRDTGVDIETGEPLYGDLRWIYRRFDRLHDTYATRLLGKWKLLHRYEIKDKQWVEVSLGTGDEGWLEYRDTGTSTYYERIGGKELRIDYDYWGAMDYVGWENVFQAYHGIDGESYNDYTAYTLNPDGTLTAYSLNFFDAGGEGVADVGRKDILVRE